jgi:predicted dehydrogenase
MGPKLKVGVVGVGGIAKVHYPGWIESPHAELVALADIKADVLKKFGEKLGVKLLYEKPEGLFANDDIDIVDICAPNRVHAPLTIAALKAGKHVICEKPLAVLPEEIEAMIRARDESGKLLMTAQHFRFDGRAVALKKEIDEGTLGPIYHARSWILRYRRRRTS